MTLSKAQTAEALFAKNIFTKTESAHIIDALFELIKPSLQNGEHVLISGFGKFAVREKHQRMGRNLHEFYHMRSEQLDERNH
jgi:integration host factor subunit alpha